MGEPPMLNPTKNVGISSKLSDELKKKRAEVSHAKKGDCNSSCYEGCEACFLDLLILEVFFSKT